MLIRRLTAGRIYCANSLLICIFRIIHHPKTLRSCDLYLHKESGPGKRSPCPGCVGVPECCLLWLSTRILRPPMYCLYSSMEPVNFKTVMPPLSLSHSPSLSFSFFWSLLSLSHFIMWYLHCHCHLRAESHRFAFFPPLPSFIVPSLQHSTISVYLVYYVFSHVSIFCQKFNVPLKSAHPSGELWVGGHQEPFCLPLACVRKISFTINLYVCVCSLCVNESLVPFRQLQLCRCHMNTWGRRGWGKDAESGFKEIGEEKGKDKKMGGQWAKGGMKKRHIWRLGGGHE